MKKALLKGAGILGIALVFGLGLILTGCDWADEAEIIITNNSTFSGHNTVAVYIFGDQGRYSLDSANCPRNESVSFTASAGEYMLRVSVGGNNFNYPKDGSTIYLRGTVRLQFTGSELRRTN